MLTSKVAKRYAQGLLNFTQESGNTSTVFGEMGDVVKTIAGSKELQNFFNSPIIDVKQEFINKVEDMNGVQRITLTSASQLSNENINNILKSTNLVNHDNKFDVKSIINPEILGGYILRVGDQQVDASVRTKLSKLKKEFQLN
jgi:F-type H+-transporting ATPase subunit delta